VIFQFIGLIIWGLIIGALARLFKRGRQNLSLLATLALGVISAIIAGVIARFLGVGNVFELNFLGVVLAVVIGVVLIGVAENMSGRGRSRV